MHTKKPNIILILSDQHNANVIGAAGDAYIKTPNLDQLYKRGTSFKQTYCNGPLCVPSRTSLLTGRLPWCTGITNNMQSLPSHVPTLAHSLSISGYETVLCGRMHFVGNDQRHGYEKRLVGDITNSHIGGGNNRDVYGIFKGTPGQSRTSIEMSGAGSSAVLDFDKDVFTAASAFVKNREDERPLFMTVGSYGPHCPYVGQEALFNHYYESLPDVFVSQAYKNDIHEAIKAWYKNRDVEDITKEDTKRVRAAYYAMVTYLDRLIGGFVETLESKMDMDNTIIVYASDHGDNIGEHGLFWKTNFYEGASRVPLVFKWENHIEAGKNIEGITSLVDLAPTLIDFASAKELPEADGNSLKDVLLGEGSLENRAILSFCSDIKGDKPSIMVRRGDYKLVVHAGYEKVQLFNLVEDPKEMHDLGGSPEHSDIIRNLQKEYEGIWAEEDALRRLDLAKKEVALIRAWDNQHRTSGIEEWSGNVLNNYLAYKKP